MSPEFYTIIGVAMALAGLIINSHRSLSASLAEVRKEHRDDTGELRKEHREIAGELRKELSALRDQMHKEIAALSERVARLEGLIEGLRDAVTGKAA